MIVVKGCLFLRSVVLVGLLTLMLPGREAGGEGTGLSGGTVPYSSRAPSAAGRAVGMMLASAPPIESQLSAGTTNLLRTIRKNVRQVIRKFRYGVGQWSRWLGGLVVFLVVGLVVPLLGREGLRTFRNEGFLAFSRQLSLAMAVYVRLLIDGRTPVVGKALLVFAVVYGAAPRDLLPDRFGVLNYVDDIVLLILASRSFMMLCPQAIVEEHALAAAARREENLRKKISRRRAAGGGASAASSAAAESNS